MTTADIILSRISPGPGTGTLRLSGTSTSGPPGLLMPTTVICAGSFSMICPCETLRMGRHLLASRAAAGNRLSRHSNTRGQRMAIEDDDKPRKKVTHDIGQDMSLLSFEELTERNELMNSGIERMLGSKAKNRTTKDAATRFF